MAFEYLYAGASPNDNTGEALRDAFLKINANYACVLLQQGTFADKAAADAALALAGGVPVDQAYIATTATGQVLIAYAGATSYTEYGGLKLPDVYLNYGQFNTKAMADAWLAANPIPSGSGAIATTANNEILVAYSGQTEFTIQGKHLENLRSDNERLLFSSGAVGFSERGLVIANPPITAPGDSQVETYTNQVMTSDQNPQRIMQVSLNQALSTIGSLEVRVCGLDTSTGESLVYAGNMFFKQTNGSAGADNVIGDAASNQAGVSPRFALQDLILDEINVPQAPEVELSTTGGLTFEVTGAAGKTIVWIARVEITRISR